MGHIICRHCGDRLSLVDDRWIHIGLPIAKAWTHGVQPVEAGSAEDWGGAGAAVPARPYPPTLSGGAAAALTFDEDEPPMDAVGGKAPRGCESERRLWQGAFSSEAPGNPER